MNQYRMVVGGLHKRPPTLLAVENPVSINGARSEERTWSYDMETMKTRWITVDQMRDRLAISKTKAYQIANDGSLDTVRIGRSLRISEESLERWLESMRYVRAIGGDEMK